MEKSENLSVGGVVEAARHTPGNAAAMRKALVELTDKVLDYLHRGLIQLPLPLEDATAKARAALSATPRNCDEVTPVVQKAGKPGKGAACPLHVRQANLTGRRPKNKPRTEKERLI